MDTDRIKQKLLDLERYADRLSKMHIRTLQEYSNSDNTIKAATERYLQLISDTEIDALVLFYKYAEKSLAGDDLSVIEKLSGTLKERTLAKVRERRALRNMLIHAYADMSYDKQVFLQASHLDDLPLFIEDVKRSLHAKR